MKSGEIEEKVSLPCWEKPKNGGKGGGEAMTDYFPRKAFLVFLQALNPTLRSQDQ